MSGGAVRRDPGAGAGAGEIAALSSRAAALLRGGVAAGEIWHTLATEAPHRASVTARDAREPAEQAGASSSRVSRAAAAVAREIDGGRDVAAALAAQPQAPWRVLAAAWLLGEQSGAPLAPVLERISAACRELERLAERRAVLHAGPRATVRLVLVLPALAFGLGAVLGFNPIPILMTGPGLFLLLGGAALLGVGVAWTRALQRRVERSDTVTGLECELMWVALGGGAAPALARLRTADAVDGAGAEWVPLWRLCRGELLDTVVETAVGTGAALRPLLLAEARAARVRAAAELEREAERFGVQILLPLGICVLPAFIAVGVAPVILAMLRGL
ncbi:type II secretion system F family protein [Leucobacter chromiireducens]|uniref:Type II secretion system protein GspF domain-containing protein n=2 Tax=Leucobacter TaxID=55968 RepID=A0ABS1SMN5_9MICO|nr:hypothetical protein [Leucobacter chromiireducens subsp. chromiireducens]